MRWGGGRVGHTESGMPARPPSGGGCTWRWICRSGGPEREKWGELRGMECETLAQPALDKHGVCGEVSGKESG